MAFHTPRRHRQYWVEPIQCLDRRLLIHAEHGGVLWRAEIQTSHNVHGSRTVFVYTLKSICATIRTRNLGFRFSSYASQGLLATPAPKLGAASPPGTTFTVSQDNEMVCSFTCGFPTFYTHYYRISKPNA